MKTVNFRFYASESRIKEAFSEGVIISNDMITIPVDPSTLTKLQRELLMRNSKYDAPSPKNPFVAEYTMGSQTYNAITLEEILEELSTKEEKAKGLEEAKQAQRAKQEEEKLSKMEQEETLKTLAKNEGFGISKSSFDNGFYLTLFNEQVSNSFSIIEKEGAHETFSKLVKSYEQRKEKEAEKLKEEQQQEDLKVSVAEWISQHGSRLAQLRLKHNFEYMKLAGREDARRIMANDPLLSDFKIISQGLYDSFYPTNQNSEPTLKLLEELDVLASIEILNSLDIEYRHEDDDTEYWITARLNVVSGVEVIIAKPI